MKVLIDVNLSPGWVDALAARGIDALHWSEVGALDAPDEKLARYAQLHRCVLFTHDLDFGAILARTRANAPSVIQIRTHDVLPEAIGDLVAEILHEHAAVLSAGALITIDERSARVRILPIRPAGKA